MAKDLHAMEFDSGTLVKLDLYRAYLREWLPVFLAKKNPTWTSVNVFDFFAGPGKDSAGTAGSPLIALDELHSYRHAIREKGLHVSLYLNELSVGKLKLLKESVAEKSKGIPVEVELSNEDFAVAFSRLYPLMNGSANLVFLDQNGIKQVTEEVFRKIVAVPTTDFLFFVASSYFRRFCEHDAFRSYVKLSRDEIEGRDSNDIHRLVLEYYRSLIPSDKAYYLAPFSIRKGANIYGLIFGSRHWLGIEKFLTSCWKKDPKRGEANFDIDGDRIHESQPYLFEELNRPKKLEIFESELEDRMRAGALSTDQAVFLYTLSNGFLPSHARRVIERLAKMGEISKAGLAISRASMKKSRKPVNIERLGSGATSGKSTS